VTPRHPDTDRPTIRLSGRQLAESGAVIPEGYFLDWDEYDDFAPVSAGLRLPAEPEAPDPATAERRRLAGALANWALSPGESFRTLLPFLDMPYTEAYRDGWMTFTNAINDRMTRAEAASQPVPTPEPPAEPDPCDGCGASRLSMRHYIGCPMASTHRWDPVVGTWVASNPRRDILDRLMELWQEPWSEPAFGEAQMLLARLRASQPVPTPERKGRITPIPELGIVALVEPVPTPEPPAEPEAPDLPNADYWRGWNVGFAVGNGDERVPDPAGTCPLCGGQGVVYDVTGTVEAAIREGAPFAAIPVPEWTGAVDPNTGVKEYGPISPASRPVPTPEPPAEPHYNAIHEDGTNGSIDRPASVPEAAPGLREALDEIESVLSDGWALRLTSRPTAGYRAEALYNDKVKVYVVAATPDGALRELSDVITESHVND
jgi:hypothetical protein